MAAPTENSLSTRVLLGVVIGLGILLLLGVGLVVGTIVMRLGAPQAPRLPDMRSLAVPPGFSVKTIATDDGYAIIHLVPAEGAPAQGEMLLWFNDFGRMRARIILTPQP